MPCSDMRPMTAKVLLSNAPTAVVEEQKQLKNYRKNAEITHLCEMTARVVAIFAKKLILIRCCSLVKQEAAGC